VVEDKESRLPGFFPMLSMIGRPSGGKPLMMDLRQSWSGSPVTERSVREWIVRPISDDLIQRKRDSLTKRGCASGYAAQIG
jgi:hypothetical protein